MKFYLSEFFVKCCSIISNLLDDDPHGVKECSWFNIFNILINLVSISHVDALCELLLKSKHFGVIRHTYDSLEKLISTPEIRDLSILSKTKDRFLSSKFNFV